VRPRPEREEAVVVACADVDDAAEAALAVLDTPLPPLWLEVAGPGVLMDRAAVAVGVAGIAAEVAAAHAAVAAAVRGRSVSAVLEGAALRARLGALAVEPGAAVLRAATLPTDVGRVMGALARAARVRCVAHAASGVVRAVFGDAGDLARTVQMLRPDLEARGGSLVIERGVPAAKTGVDPWGSPGPALALMAGVKRAFDPDGLLAPGRFVGGL